MDTATTTTRRAIPWNKGKLLGQKPPLKLKEIWAIRIRLQLDQRIRELALFNLAIDSKLRGCDLVSTGGPGIYGQFSCCSGTPSLKAPSDTSASKSTTLWRSPSQRRCSSTTLVATAKVDGR